MPGTAPAAMSSQTCPCPDGVSSLGSRETFNRHIRKWVHLHAGDQSHTGACVVSENAKVLWEGSRRGSLENS